MYNIEFGGTDIKEVESGSYQLPGDAGIIQLIYDIWTDSVYDYKSSIKYHDMQSEEGSEIGNQTIEDRSLFVSVIFIGEA